MALLNDPCLSLEQHRLRDLISDVSEACWHAGWLDGAEYGVWRLATEGGTWGDCSANDVERQLANAHTISERLGEWIVGADQADCDHIAVDLAQWESRYAVWRAANP
jgi:hypothetical protein